MLYVGDGPGLGGLQQAGELCGAVEGRARGTHEPQRHPSGQSRYCTSVLCSAAIPLDGDNVHRRRREQNIELLFTVLKRVL